MFIDRVEITVKAGRGGEGCVSFRREKYIPRGGPDGGNGGNGGDVILKARDKVPDLSSIRHKSTYKAEHGTAGRKARKQGRGGKDCVIHVPIGTIAWDEETQELLGELVAHGDKLVVAQGGKGGDGNVRFASPTNRVPQQCTPGTIGQERRIILEYSIPADVALIGLTNSGKSTMMQALTNAKPTIAEYEFTTTEPYIGVCEVSPYARFTVLDLPALCAGAADGQGLGNWFLRHMHRVAVFLFVLDSASAEPFAKQIDILKQELGQGEIDMQEKQILVAVNEKKPLTKSQKEQLDKIALPQASLNPTKKDAAQPLINQIADLLELH